MTNTCPQLLSAAIPEISVALTLRSIDRDGEPAGPRTKKNSGRIVKMKRTGRQIMLPSKAYEDWNAGVWRAMRSTGQLVRTVSVDESGIPTARWAWPNPISVPVNCRALIHRETKVGDAVGYYQAIADTLEDLGVVENDRLIVSWDGTRLLKDAKDPRVEIVLEEVR